MSRREGGGDVGAANASAHAPRADHPRAQTPESVRAAGDDGYCCAAGITMTNDLRAVAAAQKRARAAGLDDCGSRCRMSRVGVRSRRRGAEAFVFAAIVLLA